MNRLSTEASISNACQFGSRISMESPDAVVALERQLDLALAQYGRLPMVIVCVGTDRSTGDAFGPIVGSRLAHNVKLSGIHVLGTLDDPVHAVNLQATLQRIDEWYPVKPFVIAIDACLGKFDHVGQISLDVGPLRPGAGVKKVLPEFGDLCITGVVNVSGFMEYFVLQNTRLAIVMRMADIVADALTSSLARWYEQHPTRRLGM
ncbi:spore protease YyaC [Alicyclobacillus vulcanalis]|uniref:Putative sporulation protein YyaC n=1 Tax=Alicyclobacillus vulcanalis TaxID=252246 RepID=A0A1N7LNR7_9BACL|nr:spore protease YyaC [Alicyclobacillus vulcanalis]SIS75466.1 putative sporulation protein YyaC [Alicyclobacillus vulcanalis]